MYHQRDKLISVRVSSKLLDKFKKLQEEKHTVSNYAGRNHYQYYGQTLKERSVYSWMDKYSVADVLEEALEIVLEKKRHKIVFCNTNPLEEHRITFHL